MYCTWVCVCVFCFLHVSLFLVWKGKGSLFHTLKIYTYTSEWNLRIGKFSKYTNMHKMTNLFKLVSLNVRGINNFHKRRAIFTWCRKRKADINKKQIQKRIQRNNGWMNGVVRSFIHMEAQILAELQCWLEMDLIAQLTLKSTLESYL